MAAARDAVWLEYAALASAWPVGEELRLPPFSDDEEYPA
jgi:hypothetical protein